MRESVHWYLSHICTHIHLYTRYAQSKSQDILEVWDTQTGVIINTQVLNFQGLSEIMFHGDKRIITLFAGHDNKHHFYTHNALDGTQLCQGEVPTTGVHQRSTHWVHKDTLQFTTHSRVDRRSVVNLYELQPTLTLPLLLSSFSLPPQHREFSFSPVSFHACFSDKQKITILDVQNSRRLLRAKVDNYSPDGRFSPNGHFFAYQKSENEICIWQNTPTGYTPWSVLIPELPSCVLSWSPASTSILSSSTPLSSTPSSIISSSASNPFGSTLISFESKRGIQLLDPGSHQDPLSLNKINHHKSSDHLVAYSADYMYIAMARTEDNFVTILNCLSATSQQFTDPDIEILDVKIVNNTVVVLDKHKLVSWDLESGGVLQGPHGVHWAFDQYIFQTILSHDCSKIATVMGNSVLLYDVKAQKAIVGGVYNSRSGLCKEIYDIRFSLDGSKLWANDENNGYSFLGSEVAENWKSTVGVNWDELFEKYNIEVMTKKWSKDISLLFDCHLYGQYHEVDSGWVVDSQARELLWLPPTWRLEDNDKVRWDGNFLALFDRCFPEPIIIEFPSPPSSVACSSGAHPPTAI